MRRFLLVLVVALAVVAPAGAWTWPADGLVLQPFSFDRELPEGARASTAASTSQGALGAVVRAPASGRRLVRRHGADATASASRSRPPTAGR